MVWFFFGGLCDFGYGRFFLDRVLDIVGGVMLRVFFFVRLYFLFRINYFKILCIELLVYF